MIQRFNKGSRMSEAVVYNGVAYLCGQCCNEENEGKKDVQTQTREALANVDRVLHDVGTDKEKLLMVTIYLKDINYFDEMNEVYDAWVSKENPPGRACVEAKLAEKELLVEVVVTAAVDN